MKYNRMKHALENIARRGVPEDINLMPQIAATLERKTFMATLRTRPFVAMLIALFALLILSGAAYALGKSLGYFPGLGVIEQDVPFRALAAPVSQTRDGVTVTVTQVIANGDQMSLTFTVENIPADKVSTELLPNSKMCMDEAELHFPDGQVVSIFDGIINDQLSNGYESQYKFSSLPLNASEVTLFIPCIQGAREPGILPENWELPIRLVPAPAQIALTVIPHTQIPAPTQKPVEPTPMSDGTLTLTAEPIEEERLAIIDVIDTGDSYILVDAFTPPTIPANEKGHYAVSEILIDSNGQPVKWQPAPELGLTPYIIANRGKDVGAFKVTKNFVPPLHIIYRTQYIYSPATQETYTFDFDAGTNPQPGQEWILNQEFQLVGHTVTLTRITVVAGGYMFSFVTDDETVEGLGIHSPGIEIAGYTPVNFAGTYMIGSWSATKIYDVMPRGKLRITFSDLYLCGEIQDWSTDWQP